MPMSAMVSALVATAAMLTPFTVYAQVKPGEYVLGAGYGVLRIASDKGGLLRFQLSARGGNFHVCELSGVIRNGASRMDDSADDKLPCIVTFKSGKDGIAVAAQHQGTCSTYCGARAHFEGDYKLPPGGCEPSRVRQTRNQFKAAYDKKQFTEARAMLAPVVAKCGATLSEYDMAWVRNDLALTHYRAGDSAACRESLNPWIELARKSDETIRNDYPPSDADEMLRIAGATRANLKLCGAPVKISDKGGK